MLKNVLSLLLSKFYSKKESALVAHQAMPNFENAVALSLTTGNDGTYVAPADGYINVEVESSGYVNFWGGILDSASNGLWNKVAVPVSKGRTVRYHIEGQVVYAAFINLVGGGQTLKNAFLQGGGLCLKVWYSSLRRSSCRVKRRAFRTGRIPASQIVLPFSFHLQKTILFIHPQATDGCRCTLGTRERLTSQLILTQRIIAQSCLAFCLPLPVGTATFIEYVKALMSRSQFQILYRKDGLCFFRLINSAVGGASC